MSELTPEQWRRLNGMRLVLEGPCDAPECGCQSEAREHLEWMLFAEDLLGPLIDAARPKECLACDGTGDLDDDPAVGCPDCDGTGWAQ